MKTLFSITRNCCIVLGDSCGCLPGTRTGTKKINVSGLVMLEPEIADANGSFDVTVDNNCIYSASTSIPRTDPLGLTTALYQIQFTTSLVNGFPPFLGDALPPGLKAVALVSTQHFHEGQPLPDFEPGFSGISFATYFKVLAGVNGSVDCDATMSGFTLGGTFDSTTPTFDATNATVSYG